MARWQVRLATLALSVAFAGLSTVHTARAASAGPGELDSVVRAVFGQELKGCHGAFFVIYDSRRPRRSAAEPSVRSIAEQLLSTKLNGLELANHAQHEPFSAMLTIDYSKPLQARRVELGFKESAAIIITHGSGPFTDPPLLSASMSDLTVRQALDAVAKAFDVVVLGGMCPSSRLVEFWYHDDHAFSREPDPPPAGIAAVQFPSLHFEPPLPALPLER